LHVRLQAISSKFSFLVPISQFLPLSLQLPAFRAFPFVLCIAVRFLPTTVRMSLGLKLASRHASSDFQSQFPSPP